MRRFSLLLGALLTPLAAQAQEKPKWTLFIHGGAGIIEKSRITPEQEAGVSKGLHAALDAGSKVLADGGSAIDAVQAAVQVLEDDPHFNAGRGAVFTWEGRNELDAAIMDGRNRAAGSVAGVTSRAAAPRVRSICAMPLAIRVSHWSVNTGLPATQLACAVALATPTPSRARLPSATITPSRVISPFCTTRRAILSSCLSKVIPGASFSTTKPLTCPSSVSRAQMITRSAKAAGSA